MPGHSRPRYCEQVARRSDTFPLPPERKKLSSAGQVVGGGGKCQCPGLNPAILPPLRRLQWLRRNTRADREVEYKWNTRSKRNVWLPWVPI